MKKLFAYAALALAGTTHAAGVYDGIYVNLSNPTSYMSIHTNGSNVIATGYTIIAATGIVITTTLGNVTPRQLNTWDLMQGTISDNTATISGQLVYNSCNITGTYTFTETGATGQITGASNTLVGANAGVNCASILPYVQTVRYQKIF